MKSTSAEAIEIQPHQQGHRVWEPVFQVSPNEPALLLIERNEQAPDYSGFRRYQTIFIQKGQGLGKYMEDMGPVGLYLAGGFSIPGGDPGAVDTRWADWHTVDELKDYAEWMRGHLAERVLKGIHREMPDLRQGFYDQIDEEDRIKNRVSMFGPQHKVERG